MSLNFFSTKHIDYSINRFTFISCSILLPGLLILTTGCNPIPPGDAKSDSPPTKQQQKALSVNVAVASQGSLEKDIQYMGTTYPQTATQRNPRTEPPP